MELILENPVLFKKSMEIISDLVIEGTFVFKLDHVELVALNSNNVVMVIFKLLSTNFKEYNIDSETKITLNLEHFRDVLKSCDDKSPLVLDISNESKLKIISDGKNKKQFELSLIEFNDDNLQKVPSLGFPVKMVVSSSNFTSAINDLGFLEEGVSFKLKDKIFTIEGKTNTMSGKIDFKENISIEDDGKEHNCRYSMDYLKRFTKAEKLVNNVELSFSDDFPLKIEYKIIDTLLLGFILAPRGED